MKRLSLIASLVVLIACSFCTAQGAKPNIVYILADDLGYGDVQCLNPERGKIATPHVDRLAAQGMVFTDAHTSSAVCTPTRYGILTGRYNWRTHLQAGVLVGYSEPLIVRDRLTVAGFLKAQGYATACVGKWHLGLDMPFVNGRPEERHPKNVQMDWRSAIKNGPVTVGFDYFYGIPASLDMPPYIYIENDRFVGEGTSVKGFSTDINGENLRMGAASKDLEAVDVLPEIGRKAVEYISKQKGPFFAYIAFTSPHTPIVPSDEWKGKSEIGAYGDFVMQTDAVIGQIVDAVDRAGLAKNTLIIVTSDNGCSKYADIDSMKKQGHYPSAHLRGSKADLWDGGHRVPFIVRWPEGIMAGSYSEQTICLTDLMATCAELLGTQLPETAAEDSVSFLPALSGKPIVSNRIGIIHHSVSGHFAYRQGKWKLLLAKGSGGWSAPREKAVPKDSLEAQLYDMEKNPGETTNLYVSHPEVVQRLLTQLEADVQRGRSTKGPDLKNDAQEIELWKSGRN
ncbi:arylsulfatase [Planctomycetota bacterium]